jgi:hypothetical protein
VVQRKKINFFELRELRGFGFRSKCRVTEVQYTPCQPPVYTCLKWCGPTINIFSHIKSHNIDTHDVDLEDEGEDNITQMGQELAHKSV